VIVLAGMKQSYSEMNALYLSSDGAAMFYFSCDSGRVTLKLFSWRRIRLFDSISMSTKGTVCAENHFRLRRLGLTESSHQPNPKTGMSVS
jgi:hypothetical protein